jgi:nitroimidazol reductase NimA-like FMN-containing flavoprotein (pyridoxamine 5'-phosphate oxidase superfamily)
MYAEKIAMIEVEELSNAEIDVVLSRVGFGHLACCRGDKPYVVPVHYAATEGAIYVYTTEGKKADIINENPNICLQIEEVRDNRHWQSVIVDGVAARVGPGEERDRALQLIVARNPTLTPAVSIHWMDDWVRENIEVIYRIDIESTSGRRAVERTGKIPFVPRHKPMGG